MSYASRATKKRFNALAAAAPKPVTANATPKGNDPTAYVKRTPAAGDLRGYAFGKPTYYEAGDGGNGYSVVGTKALSAYAYEEANVEPRAVKAPKVANHNALIGSLGAELQPHAYLPNGRVLY